MTVIIMKLETVRRTVVNMMLGTVRKTAVIMMLGTVRRAAVFMVLGIVSDIGNHYDGDSGNRDVGDSQW